MPKLLKWIAQHSRRFSPESLLIKHRLLSAGFALSLLSLLTPFYMRSKLTSLATTYNWTASNWETLDQINEMDRILTDTESKLRAFATSGNREWLKTVARNNAEMDRLLDSLWQSAADKPNRAALLREGSYIYSRWKTEVVDSSSTRTKNLNKVALFLMTEPLVQRIHHLLDELARDIKNNNIVANRAVLKASQTAVIVVTYGGIFFFVGFAGLMVSLWFTLIPALSALVNAARELKRGNLDHRVHLSGRDETAQLGRAFNEMAVSLKAQNEKLKELNQLKSDFVSTVSHELRTPLTAIKGSIGLILGNITGPIPAEVAEMLKITQKNTDRLIRLINEVLDVAKIEAGAIQMRFDKYSLVDTLSHAILGIETFAKTQGIRLVWEKPGVSPLVVIDRDRIEQVLTNLMSNAIKFTDPDGTVTVRCEWENDRVVVEVVDTGQGIPEEFLERIFQKFQQAESSANKAKEGTGLGLTIAKAIVEEHGGSIWVNSKVGQGSTFSFSLPWNGTEFVDIKKPSTPASTAPKRRRILLVDNEPDFTTVTRVMLEHEGYDVLTCNSGRSAIESALEFKPDLILLDVMMPEINGVAVHNLLAETPSTRDIPVVFVTVAVEMKNDPALKRAAHVITKPIVPDELKAWISDFFAAHPRKAA